MDQEYSKMSIDWGKMGSSYVPALVGDPEIFITPVDVWLNMIRKKDYLDREVHERLEIGSDMELGIIRSWSRKYGIELEVNKPLHCPVNEFYRDTPDGLNVNRRTILEVKNVGSDQAWRWADYIVPKYVYVQCQWHIFIVNRCIENGTLLKDDGTKPDLIDECQVRALVGGAKYIDLTVKKDDKMMVNVLIVVNDFIDNYVKPSLEILESNPDIDVKDLPSPPPDSTERYTDFLNKKFPEHNKKEKTWIDSTNEVDVHCGKYLEVAAQIKKLEYERTYHKNFIINFIGPHYGVHSAFGNFINYMVKGRVNTDAVLEHFIKKYNIPEKEVDKIKEAKRGKGYRNFKPPQSK